jgi:beta-lactam-binding protein with PASTA domain
MVGAHRPLLENGRIQKRRTSPAGAVDRFTYTATPTATATAIATGTNNGGPSSCIVPKLKSKKLKAARKTATRAGCAVGKVKELKGATAKAGRVVKQSRKAGVSLPAGTKVAITLR